MPRVYTVPFSATLTAAGTDSDLLELTPADDKPIRLAGLRLSQISEVGDTAEEGLRIAIIRLPATVTSGSGGSAGTIGLVDSSDAAAGFTSEINNTTLATTSGSAVTIDELGWNIRNTPYETWWPDPPFRPTARGAEVLVVRSLTTPADDLTIQVTAYVVEE